MNTVTAANTQKSGSSQSALIISFTALSQESGCKKLYFSPICFTAVLLVQEKSVCAFVLPSCPTVETYTQLGCPPSFSSARLTAWGQKYQGKASHCMSHKCDGLTAVYPDCQARAIQGHLGSAPVYKISRGIIIAPQPHSAVADFNMNRVPLHRYGQSITKSDFGLCVESEAEQGLG